MSYVSNRRRLTRSGKLARVNATSKSRATKISALRINGVPTQPPRRSGAVREDPIMNNGQVKHSRGAALKKNRLSGEYLSLNNINSLPKTKRTEEILQRVNEIEELMLLEDE